MTAQKSWRKKFVSALATGTAALLAASGLALAPTAAFAEPEYGVEVTAINGQAPHAEWPAVAVNANSTITVEGVLPAEISGQTTGVYVYPCQKPADGARPVSGTCGGPQWISSVTLGEPPNPPATGIVSDGVWTFEADIAFPSALGGVDCAADGAGECGIYIRPDHRFGSAVTAYDQFIPIRLASNLGEAEEVTATTVEHPTDAENKIQINVGVVGAPFEKNALNTDTGSANSGAYFALIEKGTFLEATDNSTLANNFAFIPALMAPVGSNIQSATSTLDVNFSDLDVEKEYEVVSWRAHGNPSAERYLGATDFVLKDQLSTEQFAKLVKDTTTTVKFSKSSAKYNTANSATVTVASPAGIPVGKIALKIDGKTYNANLSGGKATIKLNKAVRAGTRTATATYTYSGSPALYKSSKATAKVKVTKASPKVSFKLAKSKIKANQKPKVKVSVSIPGSLKAKASGYKVTVYDGKKKLKTQKLNKSGKATITVKKLKRGTHKIKVKVETSKNAKSKTTSSKTLRVVK